jgi:hypothetical protein
VASYGAADQVRQALEFRLRHDSRIAAVGVGWLNPGDYAVVVELHDLEEGPGLPEVMDGVRVLRQERHAGLADRR